MLYSFLHYVFMWLQYLTFLTSGDLMGELMSEFTCSAYSNSLQSYIAVTADTRMWTVTLPQSVISGWQCLVEAAGKSYPALSQIDQ